jgi:hypothetical protein
MYMPRGATNIGGTQRILKRYFSYRKPPLAIVAHRRGVRTALGTHSEHSLNIYYEMVFCPLLAHAKRGAKAS